MPSGKSVHTLTQMTFTSQRLMSSETVTNWANFDRQFFFVPSSRTGRSSELGAQESRWRSTRSNSFEWSTGEVNSRSPMTGPPSLQWWRALVDLHLKVCPVCHRLRRHSHGNPDRHWELFLLWAHNQGWWNWYWGGGGASLNMMATMDDPMLASYRGRPPCRSPLCCAGHQLYRLSYPVPPTIYFQHFYLPLTLCLSKRETKQNGKIPARDLLPVSTSAQHNLA